MSTIKIHIKEYLAEYVQIKFSKDKNSHLVQIPKQYDLHSFIINCLNNNSLHQYSNEGNVELFIENSEDYFFISKKNTFKIEKKIRSMFWNEAFYFLIVERRCVKNYQEAASLFLEKYNITSLSEDAITKHFYRRKNNN